MRTGCQHALAVRRHAALETPHIMVLIDDPNRTVIEPLFNADWPVAYDFELMQERRPAARLARGG